MKKDQNTVERANGGPMLSRESLHNLLLETNPVYRETHERLAENREISGAKKAEQTTPKETMTTNTSNNTSTPTPRFSWWGEGTYRAH